SILAPQWIGEHDPNNNNGWIEWDVPLGGEVDEPMVDPDVNEEVMDDDDWEDDVEWLMAPVTPPRATITVSSTYEVGGPSTAAIKGPPFPLPAPGLHVPPTAIEDLSTRLGNLEHRHGVLMRKMEEVSDAEVADSIAIGEIHPRVATVGEQVQVMESQAVQVVSGLKEIETRVQQVESRVDTYSSGQMAVPGQDEIVGLSQQECLTVLEKRLPGLPPGPQKSFPFFYDLADPDVNEEVMDDDDWEDDVEWLMASVTPPRATMTVSSTYEVGGPSTAAIKGPSFPLPAPGLHVPPTAIEDLSTRLGNLEHRHGVLMRKMEEVQVMESQAVQVVSGLKEIKTRVQRVESRVDTYSSGQMAVPGQDEIVRLSLQVQTLQTALHETELQNQ
nr:hypothetical protein [Tanacetum cinerariifolium]